jgi:hypothetical protein
VEVVVLALVEVVVVVARLMAVVVYKGLLAMDVGVQMEDPQPQVEALVVVEVKLEEQHLLEVELVQTGREQDEGGAEAEAGEVRAEAGAEAEVVQLIQAEVGQLIQVVEEATLLLLSI